MLTNSSQFWVMAPTTVTPTWLPRFQTQFHARTQMLSSPTLSLVYSIVFLCILSFLTCAYLHVPILCLILCFPFMYTLHCYVLSHIPVFSDFWLCSLTLYIRLCIMYVFNMFKYWLWLLFSLSTQPLVTQTSLCQILNSIFCILALHTVSGWRQRSWGWTQGQFVRGMLGRPMVLAWWDITSLLIIYSRYFI